MKKSFILFSLIIMLIAFSSIGFANEKDILSIKAGTGYGTIGFEYEHIFQNRVAIFIGSSLKNPAKTISIGARFHGKPFNYIQNHLYYGGSFIIKEMELSSLLLNGTVGYEWNFVNGFAARAEGGINLNTKFNVNINYGASIGHEF